MSLCLCCLAETYEAAHGGEQFIFDGPASQDHAKRCAAIVLRDGGEARAAALLQAGARQVLIGQAALLDSGIIERLAGRFGPRIGLYAPVRRQAVNWSLETQSNADFKVVTPSLCQPTWEVLRADGSPTGSHAEWWIGQMLERGAHSVLLQVDIADDIDLNLCAGLVERFGERLWMAPFPGLTLPLADWIGLGQARQLALPPQLYERYAQELFAASQAQDEHALKEVL